MLALPSGRILLAGVVAAVAFLSSTQRALSEPNGSADAAIPAGDAWFCVHPLQMSTGVQDERMACARTAEACAALAGREPGATCTKQPKASVVTWFNVMQDAWSANAFASTDVCDRERLALTSNSDNKQVSACKIVGRIEPQAGQSAPPAASEDLPRKRVSRLNVVRASDGRVVSIEEDTFLAACQGKEWFMGRNGEHTHYETGRGMHEVDLRGTADDSELCRMASSDEVLRQEKHDHDKQHFESSALESVVAFGEGFVTVVTFTAYDALVDDENRKLRTEFCPGARSLGMFAGVVALIGIAVAIGRRVRKRREAGRQRVSHGAKHIV